MKISQKRYSFRKYRGVGLASVAIATLFYGSIQVRANEQEKTAAISHLTVEEEKLAEETLETGEDQLVEEVITADNSESSKEEVTTVQVLSNESTEPAVSQPEEAEAESTVRANRSASLLETAPEINYSQARGERLDKVLADLKLELGDQVTYEQLVDEQKTRYEEAIYNEYVNHLVANVMPDIKPAERYSDIRISISNPLFIQYVAEERRNPIHNGDNAAAARAAQARVIETYNKTLFEEPTADAYAKQAPEVVKSLIQTVVAGQQVAAIEQNRPAIFKGVYLLHSQYQFETDLPSRIVAQDATVTTGTVAKRSALDNLRQIGNYTLRNKSDLASLLNQTETLYTTRIQPIIGTTSQQELVEKLAQNKGESSADYFLRQTEATVQMSDQVVKDQLVPWLGGKTKLLIPLLSQGKGALVGMTRDSVILGLNKVYQIDGEVPQLETSHERGQDQAVVPSLVQQLNMLENYNTFLRDASTRGHDKTPSQAQPTVVRDSLMTGSVSPLGVDSRIWESKTTNDTVRNLFAPLVMDSSGYDVRKNIDGEKQSEFSFVAFGVKVLGQNKLGGTLYSHEMTHANDERLLFEGVYGGTGTTEPGNRRKGQGPEVYARGLFEARDNTQTTARGNIRPAFNLNTTVPVTEGKDKSDVHQIQPSQPLNTVAKLETYQTKLLKLLMWMEVKEAEVALKLSPEDRKLYFNKVNQVPRTKAETDLTSTNDEFVASTEAPNSIEDLVNGSYVVASHVANGTKRLGVVETNGYNFIPLFDSFYGANYAPEGGNTVGDISFKRNAHEILAFYGFDAMLDYLSGRYSSDQEFLAALKTRQASAPTTLEGKLEADPKATKIKQYQELLKLELQDVSDEIKAIYTPEALETAIKADLAVIKQAGTDDNFIYSNMNKVRTLKQKLLSELIETTEMMSPDNNKQVLAEKGYDVIYVANAGRGNGETSATPMNSLADALAKVREGGRIVLVDDLTERSPIAINKAVTIEGMRPDLSLQLNEDLTVTQPVTFKDMGLQLNKSSQETGTIRATADLTLNNVSTKISERQENQRPAIVLVGTDPVKFEVLNNRETKLAHVTAETESSILFTEGVAVVGAVQSQTDKPVLVTSQTNFATHFAGETLNLTLSGNSSAEMTLDNIQSLTLKNGARASLSEDTNSNINDQLTIAAGSALDATINNLSVRILDGTGILRFDESAFFEAEHSRAATTIEVTNDTLDYQDDKTYVIIPRRDVEPTVTLVQLGTSLKPDKDGHYTYHAPYQLFHEFEALGTTKVLPSSVENLRSTFTDKDDLTQAPEKPANPVQTSVDTADGRWDFKGWVLEIDDQEPKIHVYKGQWAYTPKVDKVLLTYTFVFEGKSRDQFPENQVTLPAQAEVDKGHTFVAPVSYTQVLESRDGQGEWQFTNWSLVSGAAVEVSQTITGTWAYYAYKPISVTAIYQANDQADVRIPNTIVNPGREGLQSTLTNRIVRDMQPRIEVVGTKPKVVETTEPLPTIYKPDDNLEVGQTNRIEEVGQPTVIRTTTTYKVENGQAVVDATTTDRTEGLARVEVVGTKPKVVETAETLPTLYKSDDNLEVGQSNRIEVVGQPTIITTTTTYKVENGQAVEDTTTTDRTEGFARVEVVGTKPTIERVEIAAQVLYEADNQLEVGSANVLKQAGQPGVSIKTTTYHINNGRAVPNAPTITTETGRPAIYLVGTKPKVVETTETLPTIYKSDDDLEVGQSNRVEVVGQPTVIRMTTTYKVENGQAVVDATTTDRTEGLARVEVVGTKPTIERVETAAQVLYEADNQLEVGSANVLKQAGQPGVSIKTTTYHIDNGRAVPNVPTITTETGRPAIYLVGTKPTENLRETMLNSQLIRDFNLPIGQFRRDPGHARVERVTTYYNLDPATGRVSVASQDVTLITPGKAPILWEGAAPATYNESLKPVASKVLGEQNKVTPASVPHVLSEMTGLESSESVQDFRTPVQSYSTQTLPQTGDNSNFISLGVVSGLLGLTSLVVKRKHD